MKAEERRAKAARGQNRDESRLVTRQSVTIARYPCLRAQAKPASVRASPTPLPRTLRSVSAKREERHVLRPRKPVVRALRERERADDEVAHNAPVLFGDERADRGRRNLLEELLAQLLHVVV